MDSDHRTRGAYFDGQFPPDPRTFAGVLMTRVATAIDTRDALVEAFTPVAADMTTYFPDEKAMSRPEVEQLVDAVIADHNAQVRAASPEAIQLLDAIDGFPAQGMAVSFGAGTDAAEALQTVSATAARDIAHGARIEGYVFATANDAADLILTGRLPLTYGIFAESGLDLATAAERCRGVLEQQRLPVQEHDADAQQLVVGPLRYQVPYHGHQLHERVTPPSR